MRSRTLLALAITCLLTLAACSDGEDDGDVVSPAADDTPTEEPADAPSETEAESGGDATLAVADSDLGEILVDADGLTAYVFFSDEQGGPSTCYDECEAAWPPITVDGDPVAGDGVDASLLGTTERDDGSTQVTYDGWPLYLFASDAAPGDTNGQGVGEVWFVIAPDGEPVEDTQALAGGGAYERP
jgi:predicted lipoprotein with Yx(FWY)xxD motif